MRATYKMTLAKKYASYIAQLRSLILSIKLLFSCKKANTFERVSYPGRFQDDPDLIEKAYTWIDLNSNTPVYLVVRYIATLNRIKQHFPGEWKTEHFMYVNGNIRVCLPHTSWRSSDPSAHLFVLSPVPLGSLSQQLARRVPNPNNVHMSVWSFD